MNISNRLVHWARKLALRVEGVNRVTRNREYELNLNYTNPKLESSAHFYPVQIAQLWNSLLLELVTKWTSLLSFQQIKMLVNKHYRDTLNMSLKIPAHGSQHLEVLSVTPTHLPKILSYHQLIFISLIVSSPAFLHYYRSAHFICLLTLWACSFSCETT